MKSKIGKIIMTMSLVFCMAIAMFTVHVNAADTTETDAIDSCDTRKFLPYDAETAAKYLAGENTYPKLAGYVFAGWYTDDVYADAEENLLNGAKPSGTVYALFVPEHVLSVKAQVSAHLIDDNVTDDDKTASIRFVTTVDSLLYQQVGFEVSYVDNNGNVKNATSASAKVYEKLYVAGTTASENKVWQVTPAQTFCGMSKYFKACTVTGVPETNYSTEFTVRPYWITLDGDKVYGVEATKSIDDVLREEVWVTTGGTDGLAYGGKNAPYATLDYAIAHVVDGGIIHIKDTYAVAKDAAWKKHGKNVVITGDANAGTLDLSALAGDNWCLQDGVTLKSLNMTFWSSGRTRIYAEGYDFTMNSDVVFNGTPDVIVFGGSATTDVESTNIKLYAGAYTAIYGGANDKNVTGDTNVTVGVNVNPNCSYTVHDYNHLLYGGCSTGTVKGNTNVVVESGANFNYVFGGGYNAESKVNGTTNITFSGESMAIYGGSRFGTNGDTNVIMTGGIVQQIFGGCEGNSMTGNTNVQVLGGEVERRIFGGCYNENYNFTDPNQVNGNTNVMVGPKANISFSYSGLGECVIRAVSRFSSYIVNDLFENECGTFIFNEQSEYIKYTTGTHASGYGEPAYHYLVKTNGNNADDLYGNVSPAGEWLHIEPKNNYVATVTIGDEVKYYTEGEGYYPLPELTSKDSQTEIKVTFSEKDSTGAVAGDTKVAVIAIADSEHGTVTSDKMYCLEGETITLIVTPDEGYKLSELSVMKDNAAITLDEGYSFVSAAGTYTVKATFTEKEYGVVGGTVNGATSGSITATNTTTGEVYTFEDALYEDGSYGISLPAGTYKVYFDCGDSEGLIPTVSVADGAVTDQNLAKTYQKMAIVKIGTDGTIPWTLTDNGQYTVGTDFQSVNTITMGCFDSVDFATTDFVMKTNVKTDGNQNIIIGLALSGTLNGETESAVLGWMNGNTTTIRAYSMEYSWGARQFAPTAENRKDFELTIVKQGNTLTYYVDGVQYAQWDLSQIKYVTGGAGAETVTATCDYSEMTNVKIGFGLYREDNVTFSDYSYSKNATDVAKYVGRTVTLGELADGVSIKAGELELTSGTKVIDGTEVSVNGDSISAVTVNGEPVVIEDGLVKLAVTEDVTVAVTTATKYEVGGSIGGVTNGSVTATDTTTGQVFKFTNALQADGTYNINLPNGTYKLYFDCGETEGLIPTVSVADAAVTEQNLAKTYQKMAIVKIGTAGEIPWTLTDNGQYTVGTDYTEVNTITMGCFDTVDFAETDFVMKTKVKADGEKNIIIGLALSGTLNGETESAVLGWMNGNTTTIRAYSMTNSWGARQFAPTTDNRKDFELTIVKQGNTLTYYVDGEQYAQWDLSQIKYVTGGAGAETVTATCDYSAMTNVKIGFGLYRADNVTFSDYSYSTNTADIEATLTNIEE